jgi:autotransporter-associated beta strand protein
MKTLTRQNPVKLANVFVGLLLACSINAGAATVLYLDESGTGALNTAGFTWSISGTSIWSPNSSGGGSDTAWINGDDASIALNGTTTNTVVATLSSGTLNVGNITINSMNFAAGKYTTLKIAGVSSTITAALKIADGSTISSNSTGIGNVFFDAGGYSTLMGNFSVNNKTEVLLDGYNAFVGTMTLSGSGGGSLVAIMPTSGATNASTNASSNFVINTGSAATGGMLLGQTSSTIGNLTGSSLGVVTTSTACSLTVTQSTDGEYAGVLKEASAAKALTLIKAGSAKLTVSGLNTYTGSTTVKNGTLAFNSVASGATAQALGESTSVVLGVANTSSGILQYTGAAGTLDKNITVLGNGGDTIQNSGSGLLTLSGSLVKDGTKLTLNGGTNGIKVTGTISGSSANSDTIITGGSTTFSSVNTYNGGTYVYGGGTLVNGNSSGVLPMGTSLFIGGTDNTTGTFDLGGNNQQVTALNTQGTGGAANVVTNNGSADATLTVTSGGTFAGKIKDGTTNKTALTTSGGTLTLSGTSTYTGATTVNGGTLAVNGAIASSVLSTVNTGATLTGSGTTGAVNVTTGGTLAGTLHTGALTVQSGGILSPGNSPGILSVASAQLLGGSQFTLQLNSDGTGVAGTNWDQVAITGNLDISGLSATSQLVLTLQTLDVSNALGTLGTFDQSVNHTWTSIITTGGMILPSGGFSTDLFDIVTTGFQNSYTGTFSVVQDSVNSNALDLVYTVVPEPGTYAMIVGGIGMLASFQRLRRRNQV